jgi:deoxyribose-phosphate aldolase
MTKNDVAKLIDHTILKADASANDIKNYVMRPERMVLLLFVLTPAMYHWRIPN